jgi:hypothetical protein
MASRTPILPVALLVAAVLVIVLPGDPAGLLLLTPALAVLLPLLASAYPGEKSITRLASWFSRALRTDASRPATSALAASRELFRREGFTLSNRSRGPPRLSLN